MTAEMNSSPEDLRIEERKPQPQTRLLAIGENVCDLYLTAGKMYPGGQCANTAVYAAMRGAKAAYMGVFGSDRAAAVCRCGLEAYGVDLSHCRTIHFCKTY
mgnify:CR=1 FL=1